MFISKKELERLRAAAKKVERWNSFFREAERIYKGDFIAMAYGLVKRKETK